VSCSGFRQLLVLLEDCERSIWTVLDRAVELADVECARMTLAMCTDPGWIVRWLGPLALANRVVPVIDADLETSAGHRLAQAAEVVPGSIPLTTLMLGRDTPAELTRVVPAGSYDLLVLHSRLPARSPRLRRAIARLGISVLAVSAEEISRTELLSRTARGRPKAAPR
jgi:hypothetical protein